MNLAWGINILSIAFSIPHCRLRSGTTEGIFGPTKNAWGSPFLELEESIQGKPQCIDNFPNDFFIAGGSSGGSAVAVASGACWG